MSSQEIILSLENNPEQLIEEQRQFFLVRGDKGETGDTNFASFDIDAATGELIVTTPEKYFGPEFSINETGELILTI